jgi:site-specific DNA-methyltransferase (adenine-specific)
MERESGVLIACEAMIQITNEDNMELMSRYPDKYFDLAIVDPPYGIDHANKAGKMAGQQYGNAEAKKKDYKAKDWDIDIPSLEYFNELKRVSKNYIIWGGNYFAHLLEPKSGWIFWDKDNGDNNFSDGELAYSSFNYGLRMKKITWNGMIQYDMKNKEDRFHPTQKPVALYKWILDKYAKEGEKILDTHLGSGSIAIACHDYGFDLTACELDKEYFDKAMERLNNHMAQQKLF